MSVEKANRTWHAGKPKKKPDYDREEITEELLAAVVGVYEALDEYGNHPSLQAIVDELDCGLNPLKVRKLLITAGEVQGKKIYESATVDEVLSLWKEGKSVEEIMSTLERSRASVNSYLPYTKIIYKMKESSVGADREKLYRERKKAVAEMAEEPSADNLWNAIVAFQGYPFKTSKGLSFTYKVKCFLPGRKRVSRDPQWILLFRRHWSWERRRLDRRNWACSAHRICIQCLCGLG